MRLWLLSVVAACGGAGAPAPARPEACQQVIAPMVERRVSASIAEIAAREHLDRTEHLRLDRLARQQSGRLSATMIASCTDDRWSADALDCFAHARTDAQLRGCDRLLSEGQRANAASRAGL